MEKIDAILCSTLDANDPKGLGNFLNDQASRGVNIVTSMFANCSEYKSPSGNFEGPVFPGVAE
jgi:hypothetical protein